MVGGRFDIVKDQSRLCRTLATNRQVDAEELRRRLRPIVRKIGWQKILAIIYSILAKIARILAKILHGKGLRAMRVQSRWGPKACGRQYPSTFPKKRIRANPRFKEGERTSFYSLPIWRTRKNPKFKEWKRKSSCVLLSSKTRKNRSLKLWKRKSSCTFPTVSLQKDSSIKAWAIRDGEVLNVQYESRFISGD
jgi:hypothetical protein